jgi:hypothetical protein
MRSTRTTRLAAALALALGGGQAHAWTIDYGIGVGFEHSDNLGRRVLDPRSGNRISPFIDLSAAQAGETLQANIAGSIAWNHYAGEADFDPNFSTNLGAELTWNWIPGRLLWTVEDYASQQPIDVFASDAPDNVQNANVFSTGPTLLYRLSENLGGRTELRYVNSYAEEADAFNSDRYGLTSRLLRNLDTVTTISVNVAVESVRLDEPTVAAPDFERYGVFGGWDRRGPHTTLHLDLGWNWVEPDGLDRRGGMLARASATLSPTDISTFDASLRRELSDAAADLAAGAPDVDALLLPQSTDGAGGVATLTGEVFALDRLDLGYTRTGARTTFRAGGYWSRQRYEATEALDQRNRGASATLDYALGQRSSIGAFTVLNWQRFPNTGFDSREEEYGLRWRVRVQRQLDFTFEATRAERVSSDPLNAYDEQRFYAGLVWRNR